MKERSHPFLYFRLLVTVSINSDLLGNVDLSISLFVEVSFSVVCHGMPFLPWGFSFCLLYVINGRVNSQMMNGTIIS